MTAPGGDYEAIARAVNQTALYEAAAKSIKIPVPGETHAPALIDGHVWDGRWERYAAQFAIHG